MEILVELVGECYDDVSCELLPTSIGIVNSVLAALPRLIILQDVIFQHIVRDALDYF